MRTVIDMHTSSLTSDLSYRVEPWPNGPEAYRAVFRDGSYGPASAFGKINV